MDRERQFIANLIQSIENIKLSKQYKIEPEFFQYDPIKKLFQIIIFHFNKHHDVIKDDTLKILVYSRPKLSIEDKAKIVNEFQAIKQITPISNFEVEIEDFIEYYRRVALTKAINDATEQIKNLDGTNALDVLKTNISKLEKKLSKEEITSGFFGDDIPEFKNRYVDRKLHPENYIGVNVGFPDFDTATNGLAKGTVTLIMGQMKSAKSVLLVNMANNMFNSGKKVYYHVNEGGMDLVKDRLISCATGLSYNKIRRCELDDAEKNVMDNYLDKITNSKRLFIDSVGPLQSTASFIENRVRELGTVDAILVDYIGLMSTDDKTIKSGWEKLGAIALELKNLAMKHQVPIVVLSHVNRKGMESDNKENYELEDFGLSIEPLKHVDIIASWRIIDLDEFKRNNMGTGMLSIQGARDAEQPRVSLFVDTNIMKIYQPVINTQSHQPIVTPPVEEQAQEVSQTQDFF